LPACHQIRLARRQRGLVPLRARWLAAQFGVAGCLGAAGFTFRQPDVKGALHRQLRGAFRGQKQAARQRAKAQSGPATAWPVDQGQPLRALDAGKDFRRPAHHQPMAPRQCSAASGQNTALQPMAPGFHGVRTSDTGTNSSCAPIRAVPSLVCAPRAAAQNSSSDRLAIWDNAIRIGKKTARGLLAARIIIDCRSESSTTTTAPRNLTVSEVQKRGRVEIGPGRVNGVCGHVPPASAAPRQCALGTKALIPPAGTATPFWPKAGGYNHIRLTGPKPAHPAPWSCQQPSCRKRLGPRPRRRTSSTCATCGLIRQNTAKSR